MSSIYLRRDYIGGFSIYKVERETECFYFVRFNERYEEKIPKKKLEGEYGWWNGWRIATESDIEQYRKANLIYKIKKLVDKTDFKKWSEEKLKSLILTIQQGGSDGEDSTRNPDD
jgi:hypothetical protein